MRGRSCRGMKKCRFYIQVTFALFVLEFKILIKLVSLYLNSPCIALQVWRTGRERGGLRAWRPQRSAEPQAADGQRVPKLTASAHSYVWLQRGSTHGCAEAGDVAPEPKGEWQLSWNKPLVFSDFASIFTATFSVLQCCKILHLVMKLYVYRDSPVSINIWCDLIYLSVCFFPQNWSNSFPHLSSCKSLNRALNLALSVYLLLIICLKNRS